MLSPAQASASDNDASATFALLRTMQAMVLRARRLSRDVTARSAVGEADVIVSGFENGTRLAVREGVGMLGTGFVRNAKGPAATIVSRIAVALLLFGCSNSVKISPERSAEIVQTYRKSGEIGVLYRGTRYRIRPEQKPTLELTLRSDESPTTENFTQRLESIGVRDDTLYFPGGRAVRTSEIGHAELVFEGEPPVARKPWPSNSATRPLSERSTSYGFQFGGTTVFGIVLRQRLVGPLSFDASAMAIPLPTLFVGFVSGGLVLEVPVQRRWSVYVGGGGGAFGGLAGESDEGAGEAGIAYYYGRAGVAVRLGLDLTEQIGVDGGFWRGKSYQDPAGPFLTPVAGLYWLRAIP
jgi:hypothetical protein